MVKLLGKNSIYLIGKVYEIKLQLALIEDKDISLAEYLKKQGLLNKNSLN